MATLNGIQIMRPLAVSRLLELHNAVRIVTKSVSDTRAETTTDKAHSRNLAFPVA